MPGPTPGYALESVPPPRQLPPPRTAVPVPLEAVAAFCRRWGVKEFALFGSVLRDDFRPDSDVDVMVTFETSSHPTLFTLGAMQRALEQLFGRRVDLLERDSVVSNPNPYLLKLSGFSRSDPQNVRKLQQIRTVCRFGFCQIRSLGVGQKVPENTCK